jgi:hypothetical protein
MMTLELIQVEPPMNDQFLGGAMQAIAAPRSRKLDKKFAHPIAQCQPGKMCVTVEGFEVPVVGLLSRYGMGINLK